MNEPAVRPTRKKLLICLQESEIIEILLESLSQTWADIEVSRSDDSIDLRECHFLIADEKILNKSISKPRADCHCFWMGKGAAPSQMMWIKLPCLDEELILDEILSSIPFGRTQKVLIVDDESGISHGLKGFLELWQSPRFTARTAADGRQGMAVYKDFNPDITILDLKMPVEGGVNLYKKIRKLDAKARMIVLTASVSAEELEPLSDEHAIPILEKGTEESSFPNLLREIKKQLIFS